MNANNNFKFLNVICIFNVGPRTVKQFAQVTENSSEMGKETR